MLKKSQILFLVISIFLLISQAEANLIQNGSFENASSNPGLFTTLVAGTAGSTVITDWLVSSGSIDYIGTYWQASDGVRSIDLSGSSLGGIEVSQAITTVIGQDYMVTFDIAGNPDGPPDVKQLQITVDNSTFDFSFDKSGYSRTNMGWETKMFTFTATDITTCLKFTSILGDPGIDPYYGAALDNVSMEPIPEPCTGLLFFLGLLGIVGVKKKFS